MKNVIKRALLGIKAKRTMISEPEVVERGETRCVGYRIATSMKDNRKSRDIPPFFHEVYDGRKLEGFRKDGRRKVFCIFGTMNGEGDFDYYVAEEGGIGEAAEGTEGISLASGSYVRIEVLKKSHGAVAGVLGYVMNVWLRKNGYAGRNAPCFIIYDERFHRNYEKFGCVDGKYPGKPVSVLLIPVRKAA